MTSSRADIGGPHFRFVTMISKPHVRFLKYRAALLEFLGSL